MTEETPRALMLYADGRMVGLPCYGAATYLVDEHQESGRVLRRTFEAKWTNGKRQLVYQEAGVEDYTERYRENCRRYDEEQADLQRRIVRAILDGRV